MPKKPTEQPEKQPSKQRAGRADHLKKHQFKPGQSGNPGGRPKGVLNLHPLMVKELLKVGEGGETRAERLVRILLLEMELEPAKMTPFILKLIDRDEGPVEKSPLISIDARGQVPQPPPLEPGKDGAPSFSEHLRRLSAIAKDRGLADPMEQPQDVEAEITTTDD